MELNCERVPIDLDIPNENIFIYQDTELIKAKTLAMIDAVKKGDITETMILRNDIITLVNRDVDLC